MANGKINATRSIEIQFRDDGSANMSFTFSRDDWTHLENLSMDIGDSPERLLYDTIIEGLERHGWWNPDQCQSHHTNNRSTDQAETNIVPFPMTTAIPTYNDLDDDVPF
ncbi:MAG: hypothetical protein ABJN65_12010 [Parasphingorhabdus sp.]